MNKKILLFATATLLLSVVSFAQNQVTPCQKLAAEAMIQNAMQNKPFICNAEAAARNAAMEDIINSDQTGDAAEEAMNKAEQPYQDCTNEFLTFCEQTLGN